MKFKINASVALAATIALSSPASAAINLGTLGNYGIVELGAGHNVNINSGPNTGNVLVGQGATATSAGGGNGSIIGTVYTDNTALVNFTALQTPYPNAAEVLVSSAFTLQAFNDAVALSNAAAALVPNQTLASISSATTFTCLTGGGCSQLVVNVTGNISNATITLVGDASSSFIFNIGGNYSTNKDIVLNGVNANNVLWNLLGTSGNILQTSGGAGNCGQSATCLQGTFLATHGGNFQFSNLGLTGRLVNTGGNMQIVSGSAFNAPPPPVPDATTWAMMLLGFGAIGASMRHRRRKALQTA